MSNNDNAKTNDVEPDVAAAAEVLLSVGQLFGLTCTTVSLHGLPTPDEYRAYPVYSNEESIKAALSTGDRGGYFLCHEDVFSFVPLPSPENITIRCAPCTRLAILKEKKQGKDFSLKKSGKMVLSSFCAHHGKSKTRTDPKGVVYTSKEGCVTKLEDFLQAEHDEAHPPIDDDSIPTDLPEHPVLPAAALSSVGASSDMVSNVHFQICVQC